MMHAQTLGSRLGSDERAPRSRGVDSGRPPRSADGSPSLPPELEQLEPWSSGRTWQTVACRRRDTGQTLLVTALVGAFEADARHRAEFLRRASSAFLLAELPNTWRYVSLWMWAGQTCIVAEHFHGCRLSDWMRHYASDARPVPIEACVRIVVDLLTLVRAIGGQLAPAMRKGGLGLPRIDPFAVFIDTDGGTRLAGFDAAMGQSYTQSERGLLFEELRYVPPETLEAVADERSLVYSCGLLLWELAAHRPAFRSAQDVARRAAGDDSQQLTLPEEPTLSRWVERATRARPEQRPTSRELLVDLERWLAERDLPEARQALGASVAAVMASRRRAWPSAAGSATTSPPARPLGRVRWELLVGALVALAALVLLGLLIARGASGR